MTPAFVPTSVDFDVLVMAKGLTCAFFAILFLQSGLDKVFDRKGNLEWLNGHFGQSPFRGVVAPLLVTITIVELAAGLASAVGVVGAFVPSMAILTKAGPILAALALTMLFFGQRIAKDYPGAATIASYFCVALLGMIVCGSAKLP